MALKAIFLTAAILFSTSTAIRIEIPTEEFPLTMPHVKVDEPETYLCTPIKLDKNNTHYIVGYEPKGEMYTVHHMLLYGCENPGAMEPYYSCGEMARSMEGTVQSGVCGGGQSKILYAWARNAPKLDLPEGVGFKVGKDTGINYLVLQVHYAEIDEIPEQGDNSGVLIKYTNVPQPKLAGVYFVGTGGFIPAKSTTHMEAACKIREDVVVHPFAFRTHTHGLGRVVSGWKVTDDMEWTLIGKKNPQLPQMFYPVEDKAMTLTRGDSIAARCTMVSYRKTITWVGATNEHEMCNFYMMYWVDGDKTLNNERCTSIGPPLYYWSRWIIGGGLSNIPDVEASSL